MLWVIFALITPIMWAANDILDKFILTKKLRSAYTFNVLTMIFDVIPLLLISTIFPISFSYPWSIAGLFAGLLIVPELYFYNKAMMTEEASRVGALQNIDPIFVAIMGFFLLHEPLGVPKYFGIALLVAGAILISYERSGKKFIISPALALLVAYSIILAVDSVISDYTLNFFDFWSFYAWGLVGSFAGGLMMLARGGKRRMVESDIRKCGVKPVLYVFLTCAVFYIGEISLLAGFAAGSVSLVTALASTQPFFTLLFACLISVFRPSILKEMIDRRTLSLKIAAIILIFIGTLLVVFV